jgi:hypothetical protein
MKLSPGAILGRFKGKSRLEMAEYSSMLVLLGGALLMSVGMGLNIFSTTGIATVMAALGSAICFISTVALVVVWTVKEFFSTDKD